MNDVVGRAPLPHTEIRLFLSLLSTISEKVHTCQLMVAASLYDARFTGESEYTLMICRDK